MNKILISRLRAKAGAGWHEMSCRKIFPCSLITARNLAISHCGIYRPPGWEHHYRSMERKHNDGMPACCAENPGGAPAGIF
jgi:hypothetical protein